ncbi:Fanconi anemia group B protein isoform X1 [Electrophorus electricus]|uniref:Fanconi anemia group B protein isoform X1 n=1 Tax=Electrophorus electricus TaxID=8005 RepID=UPI0015CFAFA9|nr:Fanconi anemia group B protein isoform X1 [Electrophorus electricus]
MTQSFIRGFLSDRKAGQTASVTLTEYPGRSRVRSTCVNRHLTCVAKMESERHIRIMACRGDLLLFQCRRSSSTGSEIAFWKMSFERDLGSFLNNEDCKTIMYKNSSREVDIVHCASAVDLKTRQKVPCVLLRLIKKGSQGFKYMLYSLNNLSIASLHVELTVPYEMVDNISVLSGPTLVWSHGKTIFYTSPQTGGIKNVPVLLSAILSEELPLWKRELVVVGSGMHASEDMGKQVNVTEGKTLLCFLEDGKMFSGACLLPDAYSSLIQCMVLLSAEDVDGLMQSTVLAATCRKQLLCFVNGLPEDMCLLPYEEPKSIEIVYTGASRCLLAVIFNHGNVCVVWKDTFKVAACWTGVSSLLVDDFVGCGSDQILLLFDECDLVGECPGEFLLTDLCGIHYSCGRTDEEAINPGNPSQDNVLLTVQALDSRLQSGLAFLQELQRDLSVKDQVLQQSIRALADLVSDREHLPSTPQQVLVVEILHLTYFTYPKCLKYIVYLQSMDNSRDYFGHVSGNVMSDTIRIPRPASPQICFVTIKIITTSIDLNAAHSLTKFSLLRSLLITISQYHCHYLSSLNVSQEGLVSLWDEDGEEEMHVLNKQMQTVVEECSLVQRVWYRVVGNSLVFGLLLTPATDVVEKKVTGSILWEPCGGGTAPAVVQSWSKTLWYPQPSAPRGPPAAKRSRPPGGLDAHQPRQQVLLTVTEVIPLLNFATVTCSIWVHCPSSGTEHAGHPCYLVNLDMKEVLQGKLHPSLLKDCSADSDKAREDLMCLLAVLDSWLLEINSSGHTVVDVGAWLKERLGAKHVEANPQYLLNCCTGSSAPRLFHWQVCGPFQGLLGIHCSDKLSMLQFLDSLRNFLPASHHIELLPTPAPQGTGQDLVLRLDMEMQTITDGVASLLQEDDVEGFDGGGRWDPTCLEQLQSQREEWQSERERSRRRQRPLVNAEHYRSLVEKMIQSQLDGDISALVQAQAVRAQ